MAEKKKKKNIYQKFTTFFIVIFAVGVVLWTGIYAVNRVIGEDSLTTQVGSNDSKVSTKKKSEVNALVSGTNQNLTDTMIYVNYNVETGKVAMMSIPRDTYVGRKNRNTATQNYLASYKINTVFRSGTNIPEAIDRINALTGLNLENYVIIDTKALIKLVDAIGGVTFNVPIDMYYTEDTDQNLYIDLKAGEQLIDGAKAEQLLRFRHNNDGSTYPSSYGQQDLGRMRTQREFIIATLKQTLKPQNIFKLKQVIDIMSENVKTNLDFNEIKAYVPYAVKFDADNIKTGMVPGDVEMCNGVSLYIANERKTKALVNELFPSTTSNEDESTTNTTK